MKRLVSLLLCLFLVFCFPRPAQAAIGVSEGANEIISTSNTENYDFGSVTLSGNAVIVVLAWVKASSVTLTISNVSGDALTWTRKADGIWPPASPNQYAIFWAKTPASPQASVYRVSSVGDAGSAGVLLMFQFTGADLVTSDPIKQIAVNPGDGSETANANGTFSSNLGTNNGYAAGWCGSLSANSSTPPTDWTEMADNAVSAPTTNGSGAYRAGGETGTNISFTNATAFWCFLGVEVYVDGAGPGGGTPSPRKRVIILEVADRRRLSVNTI